MSTIIEIQGLETFKKALAQYPGKAGSLLARAINASLAEVHKQADDNNFRFKTPRAKRTGRLQMSFSHGIRTATANRLEGAIGPTVRYALYVHDGTRKMSPNRFMPRIAEAATPNINKHFEGTLDHLVDLLSD